MSLDPVLLAGFVAPPYGRFLDIGCGTGALSFLLLARDPAAHGRGRRAAGAAGRAGRAGRDAQRLGRAARDRAAATCARWRGELAAAPFDLVATNPPFRPVRGRHLSPDDERALANHEVALTLAEWLDVAARAVRPGGRVAAVFPADRALRAAARRCARATCAPAAPAPGPPARRPPGRRACSSRPRAAAARPWSSSRRSSSTPEAASASRPRCGACSARPEQRRIHAGHALSRTRRADSASGGQPRSRGRVRVGGRAGSRDRGDSRAVAPASRLGLRRVRLQLARGMPRTVRSVDVTPGTRTCVARAIVGAPQAAARLVGRASTLLVGGRGAPLGPLSGHPAGRSAAPRRNRAKPA